MVIDKIGNIGKILKPNKPGNTQPAQKAVNTGSDSVSISNEAIKAQEAAQVKQAVKNSPEIRQDRIKEVKEKLANGDYDNLDNEMLDKIADRVARSFMG